MLPGAGGPLLIQSDYESSQGSADTRELLWGFNAALHFLDRKAYPFTLYYRREHPQVTTGLSGQFLAETDEYGARGVLRQPLTPVQVIWQAGHWQTEGSGTGTILDETLDDASLLTQLTYRDRDSLKLNLDWSERESRSGSVGLPIQESVLTNKMAQLDADNSFGESQAIGVRQLARWSRQETESTTLKKRAR